MAQALHRGGVVVDEHRLHGCVELRGALGKVCGVRALVLADEIAAKIAVGGSPGVRLAMLLRQLFLPVRMALEGTGSTADSELSQFQAVLGGHAGARALAVGCVPWLGKIGVENGIGEIAALELLLVLLFLLLSRSGDVLSAGGLSVVTVIGAHGVDGIRVPRSGVGLDLQGVDLLIRDLQHVTEQLCAGSGASVDAVISSGCRRHGDDLLWSWLLFFRNRVVRRIAVESVVWRRA